MLVGNCILELESCAYKRSDACVHFMKYAAITADREMIPTYVKLAWNPIESAKYPIMTGENEPNVKASV